MGVQGTLEYFSNLISSLKKKKKKKQTQTVALKIRMDCEGCARKVKHVLSRVKGTVHILLSFTPIYYHLHGSGTVSVMLYISFSLKSHIATSQIPYLICFTVGKFKIWNRSKVGGRGLEAAESNGEWICRGKESAEGCSVNKEEG